MRVLPEQQQHAGVGPAPAWWLAGAAVLAGAAIGLWPGSPVPSAGLVVPAALAIGVNAHAWRRYPRHPLRPAWLLLAIGMGLTLAGELARIAGQLGAGSLDDLVVACNLAAYPCYLLLHGVRIRRIAGRRFSLAAMLDALICALVAGALGAQVFLPLASSLSAAELAGLAMPPVMSLGLLLVSLYLVYQAPRAWQGSALALALVDLLALAANWLLALEAIVPAAAVALPAALVLLMLAFVLLAALPLVDVRQAAAAPDPAAPIRSAVVRALPLVLVGVLALQVIVFGQGGRDGRVILLPLERALGLGTLLVLLRQWLMLHANAALLGALRSANAALAQAHDQARQEARTDPLTGLPNQRLLREYLTTSLAYHRRTGLPLTVLFIDLDYFKAINDQFGHAAGDAALVEIGRRLRRALREGDVVARYAGEEFVVLLPHTGAEDGLAIAERLRQAISAAPVLLPGGQAVPITISVGLATYPVHGGAVDALLRAADTALYTAKQAGRDRVCQAGPAPLLAAGRRD
jgi:two-component system cell cycle response regulator